MDFNNLEVREVPSMVPPPPEEVISACWYPIDPQLGVKFYDPQMDMWRHFSVEECLRSSWDGRVEVLIIVERWKLNKRWGCLDSKVSQVLLVLGGCHPDPRTRNLMIPEWVRTQMDLGNIPIHRADFFS